MNYYFLLEDEKSFIKVLPKWLEHMGMSNTRVQDITYLTDNCYVMQSGQGVTQLITKVLFATIDTIVSNPGKVDELIVILDSEQFDEITRKNEVKSKIENYINDNNYNIDFTYKVFVCNHCFETWLLGNRTLYPEARPEGDFQKYYDAYNVKLYDPESMPVPQDVNETIAAYHFHYLHEMCRYNKIKYTKKKPMYMAEKSYFNQLITRAKETEHLRSFYEFYNYFNNL
jgi:hypothetical protein